MFDFIQGCFETECFTCFYWPKPDSSRWTGRGSYASSMKMRRCARSFSHTCICICNCVGNFYFSARGQVVGSEDARGPSLVHGSCETLSLARTSVCRLAITVARPGTTSIGSRRPPTRTPSAAIWDPCPAAVNILTQNILFTQLENQK